MAANKILVVEDDKFLRKVYESKLPKLGYAVVSAADGEAGLEAMKKEKPDLVLLDLIMPKMTGFEFLESVRGDGKLNKIPILVLSNLGQDEDAVRVRELGAKELLIKSNFSIKEVVEKIKQYLT